MDTKPVLETLHIAPDQMQCASLANMVIEIAVWGEKLAPAALFLLFHDSPHVHCAVGRLSPRGLPSFLPSGCPAGDMCLWEEIPVGAG